MLLIFLLIALSSSATAASPGACGPVTAVPLGADRADPVVTPAPLFLPEPALVLLRGPDELAVPALLVPGGVGSFDEFPAPLGSLPELFSPPALAGPDGTPLTAALPAPAEPALGEPAALPLPADGPLAAPPALPPLAPPPLCAFAARGDSRIAIAVIATLTDVLVIEISFFDVTVARRAGSWRNDLDRPRLDRWRCARQAAG
jgi:hypothetical protein